MESILAPLEKLKINITFVLQRNEFVVSLAAARSVHLPPHLKSSKSGEHNFCKFSILGDQAVIGL